jgi:flagellar hook-associated protein 2
MLFDMDLKELAQAAVNKKFQYQHANLTSKKTKNDTAREFVEKTKTGFTAFNTALDSVRYNNGGLVKNKLSTNNPAIASVTMKEHAKVDNVNLFVEKLASAHEIALDGLNDTGVRAEKGEFDLKVGTATFKIDFATINDLDELAKAINQHQDNNDTQTNDNLVNATVRRVDGKVLLVLKSAKTGASNNIEFTPTTPALAGASALFTPQEIAAAADAKVKLGGENSGVEFTSASNTFDNIIENAAITLTKAHKAGDTPLEIKIEKDTSATEAQAKGFADALNALKEVVKYDKENPNPYTTGLNQKINRFFSEEVNGKRLTDFGFSFDKTGNLKIDNKKLLAEVEKNPAALNELFNHPDSGLVSKFDALLSPYLDGVNGRLERDKIRLDSEAEKIERDVAEYDSKYFSAIDTHLKKFQEMERVMENMEAMLTMFDDSDNRKK